MFREQIKRVCRSEIVRYCLSVSARSPGRRIMYHRIGYVEEDRIVVLIS
jgi:hypothetical protein